MNRYFGDVNGKKVILKLFSYSDINSEYIGWLNDPVVVRYSNQRFLKHTKLTCKRYLKSFEKSDNLFLRIEQKTDGLFVGTMTAYVNMHHRTVDVGIMVGHKSVWGSGIGQDAWNTLLNWLLNQEWVRKVTAGTMRCNNAMVKIIERSGMTFEAIRPEQELLDGLPQDILYYGVFRNAV